MNSKLFEAFMTIRKSGCRKIFTISFYPNRSIPITMDVACIKNELNNLFDAFETVLKIRELISMIHTSRYAYIFETSLENRYKDHLITECLRLDKNSTFTELFCWDLVRSSLIKTIDFDARFMIINNALHVLGRQYQKYLLLYHSLNSIRIKLYSKTDIEKILIWLEIYSHLPVIDHDNTLPKYIVNMIHILFESDRGLLLLPSRLSILSKIKDLDYTDGIVIKQLKKSLGIHSS